MIQDPSLENPPSDPAADPQSSGPGPSELSPGRETSFARRDGVRLDRRQLGLGMGAVLGAAALGAPAGAARRRQPDLGTLGTPSSDVVALGEGTWALQATPMDGGFDTVCNGGIVAGTERVVVFEAFNTVQGAAWAADVCLKLTGRHPTDVVLSHYHGDHVNGAAGYQRGNEGPTIHATDTTRRLLLERNAPAPAAEGGSGALRSAGRLLLPDSVISDDADTVSLDLGGRSVELLVRSGHTPSDVVMRVPDRDVMFCGDLVFYGLFPNYMDALPSTLRKTCAELFSSPELRYVSGHGPVLDVEQMKTYFALLDDVEAAARRAKQEGTAAEEAWKAYEVPASLGNWIKFRPDIFRAAFLAWEREL